MLVLYKMEESIGHNGSFYVKMLELRGALINLKVVISWPPEQLLIFFQKQLLRNKFLPEMVQTKNVSRLSKSFHTFMNDVYNTGHREISGLFAYNPNPLRWQNPYVCFWQTYQNTVSGSQHPRATSRLLWPNTAFHSSYLEYVFMSPNYGWWSLLQLTNS